MKNCRNAETSGTPLSTISRMLKGLASVVLSISAKTKDRTLRRPFTDLLRRGANTMPFSRTTLAAFFLLWSVVALAAVAFSPAAHVVVTRSATNSCLLLSSTTAAEVPAGILKTVTKAGNPSRPVRPGDIATIKYTCYVADKNAPIARSPSQKMVVGEGSMIPGWDKAVRTMNVGERSVVRIVDPSMAYGASGVPPLIPANAILELDLEVLDAQSATANIDFDSLATADNTPRTASDIAAAYEARQALKAQLQQGKPKKEGLEAFVEKAQSFYFFGLFEGETGQQAPWFLRPSITFPLAFLVVGAAFYVSFVGGAITERGASVTDELDEIVLTTSSLFLGSVGNNLL